MALMSAAGPGRDKVLAAIAEGSQDTLESYKEQLSTTKMFYTPQSALQFGASADLKQKMDAGAAVLLRSRAAGREYQIGGRRGHPLSRWRRCRASRTGSACASILATCRWRRRGSCGRRESFCASTRSPAAPRRWMLSWMLFATGIALYFYAAQARHRENPGRPRDAHLAQMARGMYRRGDEARRKTTSSSRRRGHPCIASASAHSMLWKDTKATGAALLLQHGAADSRPCCWACTWACFLTSASSFCASFCSSTRSSRSRCCRFSSSPSASMSSSRSC